MKNISTALFLFLFLSATSVAQTEKTTQSTQVTETTATLKSASRLFDEKDDLTTVIFVIPARSNVQVLGSDSTYLYVSFDDTRGYIFNRNITLNKVVKDTVYAPIVEKPVVPQQVNNAQQQITQEESRFSILENKYGTSTAAKLYSGKIWKGMPTEMVKDSWGTPAKINRSINANIVKEEWIFNNTWLFFENDRLIDWGPVNR